MVVDALRPEITRSKELEQISKKYESSNLQDFLINSQAIPNI